MTEVALAERTPPLARQLAVVPSLNSWADEMGAAAQIARGLAATPFVPVTLRVMDHGQIDLPGTTANVAAALLTGAEIGLEPMAALRSINVINGTPALNAMAARALVISRGHELWLVESTKTRCIYQGRRAGSERTQESVWTIDRAKDLGLAGKPNWRQQPIAMLIARATAECARLVAPEVLLGLPYLAEELEDDMGEDVAAPRAPVGGEPAAPRRQSAQRRNKPRAAAASPQPAPPPVTPPPADDEPPLDDEQAAPEQAPGPATSPGSGPAPQPDEPPVPDEPADEDAFTRPRTEAQSRKLHALLRELDLTDRAAGLAEIGGILQRDITSTKDLTVGDAVQVIDALEQRTRPPDPDPQDGAL